MPIALGAALIALTYLGLSSARYVVRNYQLQGDEQQVRADIAQLKQDQARLIAVRDYLQSDEYVEDVARRTLGLVRPGETLVVVSGTTPVAGAASATPAARPTAGGAWWKSLFGAGDATPTPAVPGLR